MSKRIRLLTKAEREAGTSDERRYARAEAQRQEQARRAAQELVDEQDRERQLYVKAEVMAEERMIRANGGVVPSFATGTHAGIPEQLRSAPTRQLDDPLDPQHSPELHEAKPDYRATDPWQARYGLDEHGQPLPPDQISEAQRRARADRYAEAGDFEDVTSPDATAQAPYVPPSVDRVQIAGD